MGFSHSFLMMMLIIGARWASTRKPGDYEGPALREPSRVLSWVIGFAVWALFMWYLQSGGSGPMAVGFRYLTIMFWMAASLSAVVVIALLRAALFRPATWLYRAIALVLAAVIVGYWTVDAPGPRRSHSSESPAPAKVKDPALSPAAEARAAESERQQLITQLAAVRLASRQRWRARIDATGATGAPGVVPPMFEIVAQDRNVWEVRNLLASSTCVQINRVAPPRDSAGEWQRCELDAFNTCLEIPAYATRRIALAHGCPGTQMEYRVGRPEIAEPSWWTRTALEELDRRGPPPDASYRRWDSERLRNEIAALEKL